MEQLNNILSDEEIKAYIEYFGEDSTIAELAKSRLTE